MTYTIDPEPKVEAIFRKMWKKDSVRSDREEVAGSVRKPGNWKTA
jgi:hypothetical protein